MQKEVWKDVPNYLGQYQVSNLGNIKSLSRLDSSGHKLKERVLKSAISGGYLTVVLCKNGITKTFGVHVLVAISFLNHTPNGHTMVVNHINFNKLDNTLNNLEVVTHRENSNHKHLKSSSKYTGVSWHNRVNKWGSSIRVNNKGIYLGYFVNEIDAHNAYQDKLKSLNKQTPRN